MILMRKKKRRYLKKTTFLFMSSDCKRTHTKIEGGAQKSKMCIENCHKLLRLSEENKSTLKVEVSGVGEAKDK